jgi:hypothetical protein
MRRVLPAAIAAIALLAALVVPASAQAPPATTLTLKELGKGTKFAFIDNAPRAKISNGLPSQSLGDMTVQHKPLADAAGKRVGSLHLTCTVTVANKNPNKATALCNGIYKLATGSISVMFLTGPQAGTGEATVGSVTGGTGSYANARGVFRSVDAVPAAAGAFDTTFTLVA